MQEYELFMRNFIDSTVGAYYEATMKGYKAPESIPPIQWKLGIYWMLNLFQEL